MQHLGISFYLLFWAFVYFTSGFWGLFIFTSAVVLAGVISTAAKLGVRRLFINKPRKSEAVLITGTSSGFGRVTALRLAKNGTVVFCGVRKDADGESIQSEAATEEQKNNLVPVICDVSDCEQIEKAAALVEKICEDRSVKFIGIVNNAGYGLNYPVELASQADIKMQFEVNVFGAIAVTNRFLPLLRKHGPGGRVIFITSLMGVLSIDFTGIYSASKHALEAVADAYRGELSRFGVKVSIVAPGGFKTKFMNRARSELNFDDSLSQMTDEKARLSYEIRTKKYKELVQGMDKPGSLKLPEPTPVVDSIDYCLHSPLPPARDCVGFDSILFTPLTYLLPITIRDLLVKLLPF